MDEVRHISRTHVLLALLRVFLDLLVVFVSGLSFVLLLLVIAAVLHAQSSQVL